MAQSTVIKCLCLLALAGLSQAQTGDEEWDDDWSDDWEEVTSPWRSSGFLEWAQGRRFSDDPLFSDQTTLAELRWQQNFKYTDDDLTFNWTHDVWFDAVPDSEQAGLLFDLRELNFAFSLGHNTDVVLGRQISTWGTGDLLFINDTFPKDWVSFFSGRDDNYLKAPADAIRLTSYFKPFNLDWVITPQAEPDRFINGERFGFFSPLNQGLVGGTELINPKDSNETEYALRLFKNFKGHQLALYAYHGIEKSPLGSDANQQLFFPRKNVFGASYQSTLGSGVIHAEVGKHLALEDSTGGNPHVPNSQLRVLLGYERELVSQLNWGIQYYVERILDHQELLANSPAPQSEPEQNRQVITQRFTYRTQQDKLIWSLFVFYSPTDEDSYWRPAVNYRHNDQWQFSLGGNLFYGKEQHTFFGQFEDVSNWYARIRYQF